MQGRKRGMEAIGIDSITMVSLAPKVSKTVPRGRSIWEESFQQAPGQGASIHRDDVTVTPLYGRSGVRRATDEQERALPRVCADWLRFCKVLWRRQSYSGNSYRGWGEPEEEWRR